jgi:hypothetical protein
VWQVLALEPHPQSFLLLLFYIVSLLNQAVLDYNPV